MNRDKTLRAFAKKHNLRLVVDGSVGFGRECVGFLDPRENYPDFDPWLYGDEIVSVFDEEWNWCPKEVEDAYHKHTCMAVLVHDEDYDKALDQLLLWVHHLDKIDVTLVEFETGATGLQAMLSGKTGYAFRPTANVIATTNSN